MSRSIRDSLSTEAFDFVKRGFEPVPEKPPATKPKKSVRKGEATSVKPQPKAASRPEHRLPVSTRLRSGVVTRLKQASLHRQLRGVEPSSMQAILEQAAEEWLRRHAKEE